jgi:hypothetical protein
VLGPGQSDPDRIVGIKTIRSLDQAMLARVLPSPAPVPVPPKLTADSPSVQWGYHLRFYHKIDNSVEGSILLRKALQSETFSASGIAWFKLQGSGLLTMDPGVEFEVTDNNIFYTDELAHEADFEGAQFKFLIWNRRSAQDNYDYHLRMDVSNLSGLNANKTVTNFVRTSIRVRRISAYASRQFPGEAIQEHQLYTATTRSARTLTEPSIHVQY